MWQDAVRGMHAAADFGSEQRLKRARRHVARGLHDSVPSAARNHRPSVLIYQCN
jgi:hypothetical protein